ncbi:MAG: PAS domain S-box protein [Candidatus Kuenenia sp.]|nr:PAS domain S-box protein [Candidatus Kuenenia hertensis]
MELIIRAFERWNHEVNITVASTIREARERVAECIPDIAIVDYNLPDGKGMALIPGDKEKSCYPVVIMTGYGNERAAVSAMKAGALDYLVKSKETFAHLPRMCKSFIREWNYVVERRNLIKSLQESKQKLEHAERIAKLGHWELDLVTNALYWSDEIYRIFDRDPQKFKATYEAFLEAVHPEDRERVNKAYTDSLKYKTTYDIDHRLLMKDGTVKFVNEKCTTEYNEQGIPLRSIGIVQDITEQKLSVDLALSFAQVVENSLSEIYLFDVKTLTFIMVNKRARKNLGYSLHEISQLTLVDLAQEFTPELFEIITIPLRTGQKKEIQYSTVHRRKDGTLYNVEVNLHLSLYRRSLAFLAIMLDATERIKATNEILKLSRAIEQSPGIIVITDTKGTIEYVNPTFNKITGFATEEVLGQNLSFLKPEGISTKEYKQLWETIVSGNTWKGELCTKKKHGEFYWEAVSISPVRNAIGNITHFVAVMEDITERKQIEIVLLESERNYRRLSNEFNALLDAIERPLILLSPDLEILWENRGAKKTTFGKRFVNSAKHHCYNLWFNRSIPCEDCLVQKCFRTGKTENIQLFTPDNRFWDIKVFPVKEEKNKTHNVIMIAGDMTDEMLLREKSIRAGQLAAIGELAASVAHEINNPIYGVINCAELLIKDSLRGKKMDHDIANMIIKESYRIANVTKCLLSFVRDKEDEKSKCSIHELLSDTLTFTGTIMQKEGIKLKTNMPDSLPKITVHPQRIQQVFLNILNNARYTLNEKYPVHHKNKIIDITGSEIMLNGTPHIQMVFYDRGKGTPPDKLEKVMTPFFTTKPKNKGTGLGLSISNDIINDYNGKLEIESREGDFTKIKITLPISGKNS